MTARRPPTCPIIPLVVAKDLDIAKYRTDGGYFMTEDALHDCAVAAYWDRRAKRRVAA